MLCLLVVRDCCVVFVVKCDYELLFSSEIVFVGVVILCCCLAC